MFKEILFISLLVLGSWIVIFQIGVPMYLDTKLFPAFNRKRKELEKQVADKRDDESLDPLRAELAATNPDEPKSDTATPVVKPSKAPTKKRK